jgi:hypothetical protein
MTPSDELYQKLLEFDEDSLKAQLGIRVQERSRDPTARSASLESLDRALSATPRGGSPDRADVNFGDRYFKQLNVKSYNLMCGELFDDREVKAKLQASFKENYDKRASRTFRTDLSESIQYSFVPRCNCYVDCQNAFFSYFYNFFRYFRDNLWSLERKVR